MAQTNQLFGLCIGMAMMMAIGEGAAAGADAAVTTAASPLPDIAILQAQVKAAETAFARSMAERDFASFGSYLSEEAIFFGGAQPLHGKQQVLAGWKNYFSDAKAPFSWQADQVEVLASGTLAHSSGPVFDAAGQKIMHFNSIWRQEAPGVWRVVFDKGSPLPPVKNKQ